MRFPPDFIERLKSHVPLSSVIGKRIAVKKAGREYHALCPLHGEKTPSFTINDEKEFFHCFGCGAHGDAIGFIKDYDKLTYVEAIERLAAESGIPLPAVSPQEEERYKKTLSLYDAVEEAAQWYQKQLHTPAGREARDYISHRGIAPEMIAAFRIGFAPDSRDALRRHLSQKGFTEASLLEAGLLARTEEGQVYDRFRNRLMFPIFTATGKAVAFSGRILPSAEDKVRAKYLNSPETPLFKKGSLLFGLAQARRTIADKKTAIVVEGNLDVVMLHQAGFTNTIAPLGTALTAEQLQLLWRAAPEPVLCFDGDNAGIRAMLRAAELALPLIKSGQGLKFASLPAGDDPDTLIRRQGRESMKAVLDKASSFSEVLWHTNLAQFGSVSPEQRARLEATLAGIADTLTDNNLRQHFRNYFRDQLRAVSKGTKGKPAASKEKPRSAAVVALATGKGGSNGQRFEEHIFCLVLCQPALLQQSDIEEEFARLGLADNQLDKLRDAILQHHHETEAATGKSLSNFLIASGFSGASDRIRKQAATVVPKSLHGENINMHDAILVWHQVMHAYARNQEAGNDNKPFTEEMCERIRERVVAGDIPRAHLVFPEEN